MHFGVVVIMFIYEARHNNEVLMWKLGKAWWQQTLQKLDFILFQNKKERRVRVGMHESAGKQE